jgi:hypothetical protein
MSGFHCGWRVTTALVAFALTAVAGVVPATAQVTCDEESGKRPSSTADLAELQPDPGAAALSVALGANESVADDDVSLPSRDRRQIGVLPGDASATYVNWPRFGSDRFAGNIKLAATPGPTGNTVRVGVCIEETKRFSAGRYEGTVQIYGPKFLEFSYPLVVTTKWPFYTAVAVLFVGIAVFMLVALLTGSLTFGFEDKKRKFLASALGLGIAVGAGVMTYWSSYVSNPTWGDDPAAQIPALAVAAVTAAIGGLAAAERLLRTKQAGDGATAVVGEPESPDEVTV